MEVEWSDFLLLEDTFRKYYEFEIKPAGLSIATAETYRNAGVLMVNYFGNVEISDITVEDMQKFYEHLSTWQAPNTVRLNIICCRRVLSYCKRKKMTEIDVEDIKIPKHPKKTVEYLTPVEFDTFLDAIKRRRAGYCRINRVRNIAIMLTLYTSGIRVSELCKLNRNSIKNRQFTVVGKSKSPRICFITPETQEAISKYLKLRNDNEPALFISEKTKKRITPDAVRDVFRYGCNNSEFERVRPHTIRHSFATKMLDGGVDIRYIADLLGHESLDTTKIYTHVTNPKLKAIYDKAQMKAV